MSAAAANRLRQASPDMGDVLDHLTIAYTENYDRHGPLLGLDGIAPPAEDVAFAAEQNRRAALLNYATDPGDKAAALLDLETNRHSQISRLAFYVAGYEAAHGDPQAADPMRQLGKDHAELAAELKTRADQERPTPVDPDAADHAEAWEGYDDEALALSIGREGMSQHHGALAQLDDTTTEQRQEQAERDFASAREKLAAEDVAAHEQPEALTLEAIERDRWNAVNLPLPKDASPELLASVRDTALTLSLEKNAEMFAILSGELPGEDSGEDGPDPHELAETDWLRAESRYVAAKNLIGSRTEVAANRSPDLAAVFGGGPPFDPAEELRAEIKAEARGELGPDLMRDFVTTETRRSAALESANQNDRGRPGRDY